MEMLATEGIAIGEDLTPPLRPLAAVLRDSAIASHCSACFSALPPQSFSPITRTFAENPRHVQANTPTPLYCSITCATVDSTLHIYSAEQHLLSVFAISPPSSWHDSTDLRLSLRLAHIFQKLPRECSFSPQISFLGGEYESLLQENKETEGPDGCLERIMGLMTNRENLVLAEIKKKQIEDYDENFENVERIKEGVKMMAEARRMRGGEDVNMGGFALEEMVLCLVMTNAVEVQNKNGFCMGIAVYDSTFSWINHSCSPNSCYRFIVGPEENDEQLSLRIAPAAAGSRKNDDGSIMVGGLRCRVAERNGYGPRVVVRSIKALSKDEEVTIAYTDLLQPKEMRQAELWLKYRFSCGCKRCGAVPTSYVDCALQAHSADSPKNHENSDNEIEKVMQNLDLDDTISDYLSFGDTKSCCRNLEYLLCYGDFSAFHNLSLNAYTTLASAYKVQASDLSALSYEVEGHNLEALNLFKTSSAYSFLLAGVVNHLFMSEPAIVTAASNFWMNAGESLLNLWNDAFLKDEPLQLQFSSLLTLRCDDCSLMGDLDTSMVRPDQKMPFEEMKSRLYSCIAKITPKVWSLLTSESNFLKLIQNPVDFSWIGSPSAALEVSNTDSQLQVDICSDGMRKNLILLGIHCLRYGALLSNICYGLSVESNYRRALEVAVMKN